MQISFADEQFDGQLGRALAHVPYGGAEIGECLATAGRIQAGDYERWYAEWTATAERVYAVAEASRAAGHAVSAREAYLRASNDFRTSYIFHFGAPLDPRVGVAFDRQVDPARIALIGISWGGYLAPRAATAERRLAACIADPGQCDQIHALRSRFPLPPEVAARFPEVDPSVVQPIFDRVEDAFVTAGRAVYPGDVERALAQHPAVAEAGVVGVGEDGRQAGVAFVVREAGASVTEPELIDHCRERLAEYQVPQAVVFVDQLPRTSVGKLRRAELRRLAQPTR